MVNFGIICYGLLNLSELRGLPREVLQSAELVLKDMKASAGVCNFSESGRDPDRLKGILKSSGSANVFCKAQS